MRFFFRALCAFFVVQFMVPAAASAASAPPFEVVKDHVDIELETDGSFVETHEVVYRLLTDAAIQGMRQTQLAYTEGYQDLNVMAAYTLKPNGTRYDVAQNQMLRGFGASTAPGFEDLKTIQVIFPNLEVGDEVAITTAFRQIKPWFPGQFAETMLFTPSIVIRDAEVAITAPSALALHFDNMGLVAENPETAGNKVRRKWSYKNENAVPIESGVVSPMDTGPRLIVSTFSDNAQIADVYRGMAHGKADVTPAVKTQADRIVSGVTDRRQQAKAIYDWVAGHIGYVNIVLGAGGFVPHTADAVLQTHYGDCKDHTILLKALLAAEGIVSQPILIDAGNRFTAPAVASPFIFNHMINYIPEFQLFADSTARHVPFGELPMGDADKPVLNIDTGAAMRTAVVPADAASIHTVIDATIARDGSADGNSRITTTGPFATAFRALSELINASNEANLFQKFLGPAGTGTFDKGNIDSDSPYIFGAHFHQENAASMPGPAGMYPEVGFRVALFTPVVGGDMPATREEPYECGSLLMTEDVTLKFPDGIKFTHIPEPRDIRTEGVSFSQDIERVDTTTLHTVTTLRLDHPQMTCTPEYYTRVRPKLAEMITALGEQVVYVLRGQKQ